MKTLILTLLLGLTASLAHARTASLLRLDTAHAFGGSCVDAICFDGLIQNRAIGVIIMGDELSFVDRDENGEAIRIYLQKAAPCADSDSDPEGAREFFIDVERGLWSDEAKPLLQCADDLIS